MEQHSSVRIVCADNGVKGNVRELTTLATRDNESTKTKERERILDRSKLYYLLATEIDNLETVKQLSKNLKENDCDPYAGVGPDGSHCKNDRLCRQNLC